MRTRLVYVVITLIVLTACATPESRETIEKHVDLNAPFDEVWSSAIEGLARSGEIITHTEKESGLIVLEKKVPGGQIPKITTASGSWTTWHGGRVKSNIFIKPLSDSSTRVSANVCLTGSGVPYSKTFPREFTLESNGTMEKTYLGLIKNLAYRGEAFPVLEGKKKRDKKVETPEKTMPYKDTKVTKDVQPPSKGVDKVMAVTDDEIVLVDEAQPSILKEPTVKEDSSCAIKMADAITHIDSLIEGDVLKIIITANGRMPKYNAFLLDDPTRLVIDIFDITEAPPERLVEINSLQIDRIRIGTHPEKVRLCLDSSKEEIPPHRIISNGDRLVIVIGLELQ
jgi:DNA-directed RNA polymerase subunit H (RpoH/RPB5)